MKNPLLEKFNTVYSSAPFSKIKNEHFKPAFIEGIKIAKEEIDQIANNEDPPTFENTIEALEFCSEKLDRISSVFFNLNSAETNDEIQQIAQEVSPMLSEFSNDITLNEKIFKRVQFLNNIKEELNLSIEQDMLLSKKYKSFTRNGANLEIDKKDELRKIDTELSKLKLKFGEHVLAETNAFELHLTTEDQLAGLPESVIEAAAINAKHKNKDGWVITLDYPSYVPFMMYAEDRNLRKKLAIAFGAKAFKNNKYDNQQIVLDIVNYRHKRAVLLGYKSHAHFVLEERMAQTPENVNTFLNDILKKASPAAKKEFTQLTEIAKKDGIEKLEKWDGSYYSEKLKKELFDLEEERLKPYFKLENVIAGVFQISTKLYDLQFEEITTIDTYHKDVITYKVTDTSGNYIAILYADFFPRPGKRNGAWMTTFKGQWVKNGENSRPHISIVCNFTKPTETKPSLLTFNEVTTLFHEFGHALHGMLADTTYPSLSGTNVYWDFVELPSQLFENWCYQKEALNLFAKHFETNELIPMELIDKIKRSSNFLEGMHTVRQISFGLLDMNWHSKNPSEIKNVKEFELTSFKNTNLYPDIKENCMSTSFSHIFQGGYSSGYYSYKWAEVLDADAFALFLEKGIFDKETARKFKSFVLERGGTENPMKLYKLFRGKKPDNTALLKRAGLLK
ncbi:MULTISPECIES: M3 family metallopeptidase [Flavobacteriaceae]|uniref:M3 family peptidase n=2 Tax=Flavobacteriaceae TaxID=49546 RepID=A0A4Y8AP90_9FLAO|nr:MULTISPECIES: M3 family metallopeptidase [Flavobacteriaceae]TEW72428.1 M3 family peptidase [Gramella jeungdoensis]GGK55982.1 peptidase M3 [Lutibacter litoralis]